MTPEERVKRAFVSRLACHPQHLRWLHLPIPRARKGSQARRWEDSQRLAQLHQAEQWLRQRDRGALIWRANTGVFRTPAGRPVQCGLWGQADLDGVVKVSPSGASGTRLAIEIKAGDARLSPQQLAYRGLVIAAGGLHLVVRDPAQGEQDLLELLGLTSAREPRPSPQR